MADSNNKDTVKKILDVAESLFAQKGFRETSLRTITSKAGVNLAAVNYHFGSKEQLIQAVFARTLTPFCDALEKRLIEHVHSGEKHYTLEELFDVLVLTAAQVYGGDVSRFTLFMRLLGLAYTQVQDHLRAFLSENYGSVFKRILVHIKMAAPDMPPKELFWRIHFSLGAAVFTLSSYETLREIMAEDYQVNISLDGTMKRLIPYMASGIRADVID
ncbi:MAG TPA: TetR/AcrR family transcriptional regulator [Pseudomonadales bacterium]